MELTVIILTYNEELHLQRCLDNAKRLTNRILIIDSYSTDNTLRIAEQARAIIYQHPFISQAKQLEWALTNCPIETEWVIRLDADEYLTDELIDEIQTRLSTLPKEITGVFFKRRHIFMNQWIRFGGRYPLLILRMWKHRKASVEDKWMDEHIILKEGTSLIFKHDFVDHNLRSLTWFIEKHNHYATREAIELLTQEFTLTPQENFLDNSKIISNSTHRKRFLKGLIYPRELLLIRAILYFLYRYVCQLGFMDGRKGLIYHFLQGCWYRFLADAKVFDIKRLSQHQSIHITEAIEQYSGYKINQHAD